MGRNPKMSLDAILPTLWGDLHLLSRRAGGIPGGLAQGMEPSDFDSGELETGVEIEQEHFVNDGRYTEDELQDLAQEIAMDHLVELPDYYTRLQKMEQEAEGASKTAAQTGDGESVGFFIPLPESLAAQYPSLAPFDDSPPHITFLYVGELPKERRESFLMAAQKAFSNIEGPIQATLCGVDVFQSSDKRVAHSKIRFSVDLVQAHDKIRASLAADGFEVEHSFPFLTPHVTLAYMEPFEVWEGVIPVGSWVFDRIQVWGLPALEELMLGTQVLGTTPPPELGAKRFASLYAKRENEALLRAGWLGLDR